MNRKSSRASESVIGEIDGLSEWNAVWGHKRIEVQVLYYGWIDLREPARVCWPAMVMTLTSAGSPVWGVGRSLQSGYSELSLSSTRFEVTRYGNNSRVSALFCSARTIQFQSQACAHAGSCAIESGDRIGLPMQL